MRCKQCACFCAACRRRPPRFERGRRHGRTSRRRALRRPRAAVNTGRKPLSVSIAICFATLARQTGVAHGCVRLREFNKRALCACDHFRIGAVDLRSFRGKPKAAAQIGYNNKPLTYGDRGNLGSRGRERAPSSSAAAVAFEKSLTLLCERRATRLHRLPP